MNANLGRRMRVAAFSLVICLGTLGLAHADDAAPPPMNPLTFDGNGYVEYPGTPAYQLVSGTIDLYFRPGWNGADVDDDPDYLGGPSCLISCAADNRRTRYGIYLADHLDALCFWNGVRWEEVPYTFDRDRWYHLAAVLSPQRTTFVVNGRAIGSVPIGPNTGWPGSNFDLIIGSSGQGSNAFYGEIANVRLWKQPLPLALLADMGAYYGEPADPELASCLLAFSNWTAGARDMLTLPAGALDDSVAAERARSPFRAGPLHWKTDRDGVLADAKASGSLVFAYTTCSDGWDTAAEAFERGTLRADALPAACAGFTPLLLSARHGEAPPLGIPIGSCGVLTPDGRLVRLFQPWTPEFVAGALAEAKDAARLASSGSPAQRATLLLARVDGRDDDGAISDLRALASDPAVQADTLLRARVDEAVQLQGIRAFMRDFRTRKPFSPPTGKSVAFDDAHRLYVDRALELFLALPYVPSPQADLADFAGLVWEAALGEDNDIVVGSAGSFVLPLAAIDPELEAFVAAVTPPSYLP